MRTNRIIDASVDEVESAKETAASLIGNQTTTTALELFYTDNLEEIEHGIKQLNDFSNKSWLLSAILLYTIVYNRELYTQSGLDWIEYSKQARERLGLDPRDITEQLSAARFFIMNHDEFQRLGFNPAGSNRKLARAELATELCGDVHEVIQHVVKDSWREYNDWYSSFKTKKLITTTETKRNDLRIEGNRYIINNTDAVVISNDIPDSDKERLKDYMNQIFNAMQNGYELAIVPVYDKKEASLLPKLRDKYRQGK